MDGLFDQDLEFGFEAHLPIVPKMKSCLLNHTRPNYSFEASYEMRRMTTPALFAESGGSTGTVFNLQRCSVHDGPGIRTTVFLKGCPLACTWCHNPEGIETAPVLMLSADRCLSCRMCAEACPIDDGGAAPAGEPWERSRCTRCGSCVEACPADARELAGREYRVAELLEAIERDRVFYDTSDGGVTFSGGEPLAQAGFLVDCLRECRRRGLHTAVDTCGLAPRETLLEIAELTDLVLYDLKHMDPDRHRAETGADNRIILDNLRALSARGTELWIRVPLIPGFNDDPENIDATGAFLEVLPRRHPVCVLPYHGIAEGKRSRLEEDAARCELRTPAVELVDEVARQLAIHDLEVSVGASP
jgi:pyruvate formate lyase activating enzyme